MGCIELFETSAKLGTCPMSLPKVLITVYHEILEPNVALIIELENPCAGFWADMAVAWLPGLLKILMCVCWGWGVRGRWPDLSTNRSWRSQSQKQHKKCCRH